MATQDLQSAVAMASTSPVSKDEKMYIFFLAAVIIGITGAVVLYLGSPHQRLLQRKLTQKSSIAAGTGGLVLSLILFGKAVSPLTAIFCLFVLMMLVWSVLPFVAFLKREEGN
ncbi:hypothetical protein [Emcibacter nanhaiensis]|uniref:Uncharacterized protein n=1 Tax=Emcibacter nanhaiensis TaxID=1505037 RepID=A0A501PRP2_9PROT|nr:hypothetical protein [Emcibacter nanhaiensis]TPD62787.1 hypothetical protein FIV46_01535 [Emcibacter nanhaiensis]